MWIRISIALLFTATLSAYTAQSGGGSSLLEDGLTLTKLLRIKREPRRIPNSMLKNHMRYHRISRHWVAQGPSVIENSGHGRRSMKACMQQKCSSKVDEDPVCGGTNANCYTSEDCCSHLQCRAMHPDVFTCQHLYNDY